MAPAACALGDIMSALGKILDLPVGGRKRPLVWVKLSGEYYHAGPDGSR